MVKFSKELDAQLIPEWRDAFVNYRDLKKLVKTIKLSSITHASSATSDAGFSILDPIRFLASRLLPQGTTSQGDEENLYEMELVNSREDEIKDFLDKLDEELKKVNNFYKARESEFCERGEALNKQLQNLMDIKDILDKHRRKRHSQHSSSPTSPDASPGADSLFSRLSSFNESTTDSEAPPSLSEGSPVAEEMIAALEKNGVSFIGVPRAKAKKLGKVRVPSLRIDIPATTPSKTLAAIAKILEDVVNGSQKDGGEYVTGKKIQYAEKMIRKAFVEFYKGLGLLKTYSSLNMVAFRKILKKFDKVSNQRESDRFLKKVKGSEFVSSDKVVKLSDEVESIFIKYFARNDKKAAMKFLKPLQPKDSHMITFFVGLFTGSFVTLFSVYAFLAHLFGIFSNPQSTGGYMETVYPVFSIFALLSLHIFLYGCNLFMWRSTRINYNFIFEFSPNTALKHRDAFLICTSFMTAVVGAMVLHLFLQSAGVPRQFLDPIPGILFLLYIGTLICPFNVFYRSTRYCLLRVIRNIVCSPFYRVLMVDFFMADQLTSQIPLLRHMEFTTCYFMAGGFKTHSNEICTQSHKYKLLAYVISFLPYYWRTMQCARRYIEEGYDPNHLANAGKYISAMVAAAARMKYAVDPSPFWLAIVIISSTMATFYQLYWDFVKDWGFFTLNSRNPWLRDELVLKNKSIYYVSIALNFVLRLAWIETVLRLSLGIIEHRLVDFLLASLEIIRRGHWNFYRLENEHLNNAGKFRAVRTVPLPFREMESDG